MNSPGSTQLIRTTVLVAISATPFPVPPADRRAGLRYVNNREEPGITRRRSDKGFSYRQPDGSRLRDEVEIERIAAW